MSKTYEECLDEVARKYNGFPNQPYKDWKDMESTLTLIPTKESLGNLFARFEEAALLYGEIMYQNGYFEALKDIQNLRDHSNDISKPIKF